jgi:hypothetical protein
MRRRWPDEHGAARACTNGRTALNTDPSVATLEPPRHARALGDDSRYGDLDAWAREHGISDEWLDAALSAGCYPGAASESSRSDEGMRGTRAAQHEPNTRNPTPQSSP